MAERGSRSFLVAVTKHVNLADKSCHTHTGLFPQVFYDPDILIKNRIGKIGTEFALYVCPKAIRGSKIILCCLTTLTTFDVLDPLIAD